MGKTFYLALIVILIIIIAWYLLRCIIGINTSDLIGHWANSDGAHYRIAKKSRKSFVVYTASLKNPAPGKISGLRRVTIVFPDENPLKGSLNFSGRLIEWSDGTEWKKQGI